MLCLKCTYASEKWGIMGYQFLPSHSICISSVYEFAMVIKYMLSYDDGAGPDFNYAPMLQVSLCSRVHNSGIYQPNIPK